MLKKINAFSPNPGKQWERRKPTLSVNFRHIGYAPRRGLDATKGSHKNSYVDWYSPDMLMVTILLSLLSLFDSLLTRQIIALGGSEENYLMEAAIIHGQMYFITIKFLLTSLGIIFLVIHKNFVILKAFRVEQFLYLSLFAYCGLMIWETHLLNLASHSN